jgi:hypothetical protein
VAAFPKFGRAMQLFSNGDFDASISSPRRSKARALVCQARGGDVWVRLGPPRTFYLVDSPRDWSMSWPRYCGMMRTWSYCSSGDSGRVRRSCHAVLGPRRTSVRVPASSHGRASSIAGCEPLFWRNRTGPPNHRLQPSAPGVILRRRG